MANLEQIELPKESYNNMVETIITLRTENDKLKNENKHLYANYEALNELENKASNELEWLDLERSAEKHRQALTEQIEQKQSELQQLRANKDQVDPQIIEQAEREVYQLISQANTIFARNYEQLRLLEKKNKESEAEIKKQREALQRLRDERINLHNAIDSQEKWSIDLVNSPGKINTILKLEDWPDELTGYDFRMNDYVKLLTEQKAIVYLLLGHDYNSNCFLLKIGSAIEWSHRRALYNATADISDCNYFLDGSQVLVADAFLPIEFEYFTHFQWELLARKVFELKTNVQAVYGNEWFKLDNLSELTLLKQIYGWFREHQHTDNWLYQQAQHISNNHSKNQYERNKAITNLARVIVNGKETNE